MAPRSASKSAVPSDKVGVICRALGARSSSRRWSPAQSCPKRARRTLRRQPYDRAPCARTARRRRLGRTSPQPDRGGGDPELAGRPRHVRHPDRARAAGNAAARGQAHQGPGRRARRPRRRRERARGGPDAVSIRLATEFHMLLATMTNSPVMVRYVSEIAYRCCLTLSLVQQATFVGMRVNEHRHYRRAGQG